MAIHQITHAVSLIETARSLIQTVVRVVGPSSSELLISHQRGVRRRAYLRKALSMCDEEPPFRSLEIEKMPLLKESATAARFEWTFTSHQRGFSKMGVFAFDWQISRQSFACYSQTQRIFGTIRQHRFVILISLGRGDRERGTISRPGDVSPSSGPATSHYSR